MSTPRIEKVESLVEAATIALDVIATTDTDITPAEIMSACMTLLQRCIRITLLLCPEADKAHNQSLIRGSLQSLILETITVPTDSTLKH